MNTFVTVVESGGFTAAARKLDISLSAVSRIVTELEAHLGVRLLTRTTRVVRPTDTGLAYFENCKRILGEVEDAELTATGTHSAPRGQLVLTAPVLFGTRYAMPIVTEYLQRYPEVSVNCVFADRNINLIDEGVDVGLRIGELPGSSLQAIAVGRVRRVVCAAPSYLAQHGVPKQPEDLAQHTLVHFTGISTLPEWRFVHQGEARLLRFAPRLAVTSNDAAIAAAVAGVGMVRALSYQVAGELWDGRLRVVLAEYEPAPLPIQVIHREGRHALRKVRAFLDLAIDRLRADKSLN